MDFDESSSRSLRSCPSSSSLPGMVLHYMTKWRSSKSLTADDERMLEDLWRSARAMERRIETLEKLVEPEHADERNDMRGDRPQTRMEGQLDG